MAINKSECPKYLIDYLFYLEIIKGRSKRTVEAYYIDLRLFLRYLKYKNQNMPENTDFEQISILDIPEEYISKFTRKDAIEFLYFTSDKRENSAATRARKISALQGFFKYLVQNTMIIKENPIKELDVPSVKHSLPHYLSLEQSIDLLNSVKSKYSERDYCILTFFLNCGMRLSELIGINMSDINFENRTLRLLGKGNKERIVFLNDACIESLKNYLGKRGNGTYGTGNDNPLFLSRENKRISKRRVQQIVEDSLKTAGLDNQGLSTHKLRHTAATLMYQHGNVDTLVLKEVLGHKSIATTEIYTHLANDTVKQAIESNPLANVKQKKKTSK